MFQFTGSSVTQSPANLFWPRVYPVRFGLHAVQLMPQLKTQGRGLPSVPDVPDGPEIFQRMAWESDVDWTAAHLTPLLVYLKGNSSLNLPEKWQAVFPRHIWHAPEDLLPDVIWNIMWYCPPKLIAIRVTYSHNACPSNSGWHLVTIETDSYGWTFWTLTIFLGSEGLC